MQTRRIGGAGFDVGAVGLCCLRLSAGHDRHPEGDAAGVALVHQALDRGVTLVSTSDSSVANELLLGRALSGRRDEAVVATRVGLAAQGDGRTVRRAHPEHIATAIDHSLRRLRTDRVDLYLLEAVDPQVPAEDSWAAMARLVADGRARALGAVTDDVALAARLQSVFPITAIAAPASLLSLPHDLVRWCADRGIGLLASSPLAGGRLAAAGGCGRPALDEWLARTADRHAVSLAAAAVAGLLASSPCLVAVPAVSSAGHLEEVTAGASVVLDDADRAVLAGTG